MRITVRFGVVLFGTIVAISAISCLAADAENAARAGQNAPPQSETQAGRPAPDAAGRTSATRSTTGLSRSAASGNNSATGIPRSLHFQFRAAPWKDVLEWFARQADLSLIAENYPQGTFNYTDSREYTPSEAIDLINRVLLTKGYTLIRRDRMLMLINLEDGIPPNLVETVSVDSLDDRGEFELVRVLFDLDRFKPEEAELEVKKLLGPQGSAIALPKSRQLMVTDTAGRLRSIRAMIKRIEQPEGSGTSNFRTVQLKYVRPDDVMPILRQMLDIPEDRMSSGDLRIAVEPRSGRLMFISGQPEKVGRAVDIIQELDVPSRGRVRTFPMSPEAAKTAVDRIETVWPNLRSNKLHVVGPSAAAPVNPPAANKPSPESAPANPLKSRDLPAPAIQHDNTAPAKKPASGTTTQSGVQPQSLLEKPSRLLALAESRAVAVPDAIPTGTWGAHIVLVAEQLPAKSPGARAQPSAPPVAPAREQPPVIVMIGPSGLTVISDDPGALDEFERLLGMVASPESNGPLLPVFYLKYAKAATVAEALERIFSGAESAGAAKEGDSTVSSSVTGREGSPRALATGPIRIIPDARLNALMVQANHTDLEKIRQVLEVLDMKESPEDVSVGAKPRMIAVVHTRATEVAEVIREVYADRMISASGSNQGGAPGFGGRGNGGGGRGNRGGGRGNRGGGGNEGEGGFGDFGGFGGMAAIAARMAGGGGDQTNRRDEANRIGVGVNARTNSLVVTATDPVFEEIKQLVGELDVQAADQTSAVQVIALHTTSAEAMERALSALAGDGVQINHGEPANAQQPTAANESSAQQPAWLQRATRARPTGGQGGQGGYNGGGFPQFQGGGYNGGGYPGGGGGRGRFGRGGQQGPGQGQPGGQ